MQVRAVKFKFVTLLFLIGMVAAFLGSATAVNAWGEAVPSCLSGSFTLSPDGTAVTGTVVNNCAQPYDVGAISYISFVDNNGVRLLQEYDGPYFQTVPANGTVTFTLQLETCASKPLMFIGTNPGSQENRIDQQFYNVKAGACTPAALGDFVWEDLNSNGIQDEANTGVGNVTVTLLKPGADRVCRSGDEVALSSTTTSASGFYSFTNLLPGGYCVDFTLPTGFAFTTPNQGTNPGLNSDADPATGQTVLIDLDSGETDLTWDAGLTRGDRTATVGDRVWYDNDGDGVQDGGEPGIPGVTVNLTNCSGTILASDVTDANGNYLFDGLAAGTYCVVIDQGTLPPNVAQTFEKDGSLNGDTQQPLMAGDDIRDVDFGYIVVAVHLEKYTRVEVAQSGGDLCDTYGRPQLLTMRYTGDNVNDNIQDPSKVTIVGDPMFATPVLIVSSESANGGGKIYFSGQVNLNETFTINATLPGDSELRSETYVTIYDLFGNVLQSILFHTSCSQPLILGDQYGSIQLVGFRDKDGGGEDLPLTSDFGDDADAPTGPTAVVGDTIVWTYIVTNAGTAPLANVAVVDDAGTPADMSDDFAPTATAVNNINVGDTNGNGLLETGEAWQFTATGTATVGQYGNVALVSATGAGVIVTDDDPSHYLGVYSGADLCDTYGKPQLLTMLYTGDNVNDNTQDPSKVSIVGDPMFASPVTIIASEKADGTGKIYFNGVVNLGETFVIDARLAGDSELRSETWVTIYDMNGNVLQSILFHTSCSQPLALGDQFGGIQLVGFRDKDGGGEGDIPDTPVVPVDLCDTYGKPQLLAMLYTGDNVNDNTQDPSKVSIVGDPMFASPVTIIASEKADGAGKVYFIGEVNLGGTFVIDARLAGDSELRSETWVTIYDMNGNVLQSILFHTSCSQPLILGDQFGGIQLVGFRDKDGGGDGDIPDAPVVPVDLCDTYGKPQFLTMLYTGDNINDNTQDPSKVVITGNPLFATPVTIVASEKSGGTGRIYFNGQVNLGETFTIDARLAGDSELRSETWVTIYGANGNVLQSIKFHTSCSQPMKLDDQFGAIQLKGFQDKDGGGAGDVPPVPVVRVDLCPTYGKPQTLTMVYTGDNVQDYYQDQSKVAITGNAMFASPVRIVASEKSNGTGRIYFNGQVNLGGTFTIDARTSGDSELRSETWVTIYDLQGNVLQSIKFHTSCSQPLTLGDQYGGMQLVGLTNKNGAGEQLPR